MSNLYFASLSDAELKAYNTQTALNSIYKCFNNLPHLIETISNSTGNEYITEELKQYNDILIYHVDNIYEYSKSIIKSIETARNEYGQQDGMNLRVLHSCDTENAETAE